jgi:O-antigen ligase
LGLYVYVLFAIIKPEALWSWSLPQGSNFSRIVAIAMLAGWALHGFGNWSLGKARAVVIAFIGFWLWSVLSGLFAPDGERSWYFIESIAKILIPFIVGITVLDSIAQLRQLAWIILLGHGYLAFEFNQQYFAGFNVVKEVGFAGMEEGSVAIGMVCASGVALFVGLTEKSWWRKAVAFASLLLIIHVVFLSFSRGGMLGLIVASVVAFLVVPKRPLDLAALSLVVLVAMALMGREVRARLATAVADSDKLDSSAQSRLDLWANCCETMVQHPVLGVGPYHFPLMVHTFGWQRGKEAHTLWLQIGAELGFPGLLLLLAFYGVCVARLWRLAFKRTFTEDPWLQALARMVITSIVGFAIAAQFISLWGLEIPYYVILVGAGVLKLTSGFGDHGDADSPTCEAETGETQASANCPLGPHEAISSIQKASSSPPLQAV